MASTERPKRPPQPQLGPVRLLHKLKKLTPSELERVLGRTNDRPYSDTGWSVRARRDGLFIDISRVEWVELSAVVRLVLLVESALRDGLTVEFALPLATKRRTESFYSDPRNEPLASRRREILKRVERRRGARNFLDRLAFTQALTAPHLRALPGKLRILDDYDSSQTDPVEARQSELHEAEAEAPPARDRAQYVVPLEWVVPVAEENAATLEHLASVIGAQARGISSAFDGDALAQVVLYELVQNALQHSQASHALVAAFAQPATLRQREEEYTPAEHGYMNWLNHPGRPSVEVIVGDSGIGVARHLGAAYDRALEAGHSVPELQGRDASVALWAFDRRSTSSTEDRTGARGLYRVDRIVKRHFGLVTIRTADQLVGWDHGGPDHDHALVESIRLPFLPGTVLRARLTSLPGPIPHRARLAPPREMTFSFGTVRQAGDRFAIDRPAKPPGVSAASHCLVLVPEYEMTPQERATVIRALASERDPDAMAFVGVPAFSDAKTECASINEDVAQARSHDEGAAAAIHSVHDPVLVVGERPGDAAWAGTTPDVASVLKHLLDAPDAKATGHEIRQLIPDETRRSDVMATLRRDATARLVGDGAELRLHMRALTDAIAAYFDDQVCAALDDRTDRQVRITPSLAVVDGWIDAASLLSRPTDLRLAALALAYRVEGRLGAGVTDLVLADTSVDRHRLTAIQDALRADRQETVPIEVGTDGAEGVDIAHSGDRVVVYADLIASAESVRRCLSQVLRDGAEPLGVICLVDSRDCPGAPVELWGLKLPVISLVRRSASTSLNPGTDPVFVNARNEPERMPPNVERELEPPEGEGLYPLRPHHLLEVAADRDAVHFGHIGGNAGRHFTFYVNADPLMEAPELVCLLDNTVRAWKQPGDDGSLAILYPTPEPKVSKPSEKLAHRIKSQYPGALLRGVARQPVWGGWKFPPSLSGSLAKTDVVIVDWGALEGTTILEMLRLAAESGAHRILVCVCLSQLSPESEWQLRAMRTIEVRVPAANLSGQVGEQLRLGGNQTSVNHSVAVSVRFLSAIPVPAFTAAACPICQQAKRLSATSMPTKLLQDFAERQRDDRLHLTPREEEVGRAISDLSSGLIGGAATVRMLDWRRKLERALRWTRARFELDQNIRRMADALADGRLDSHSASTTSSTRDLIRLLASETQWLRRPPLVFDDVRGRVATLAAAVVLDEESTVGDRINAIIVLRTSSKREFARCAPDIYLTVHQDPEALGHLFHGLLTYTDRRYLRTAGVWEPLVSALKSMRAHVRSGDVPQSAGSWEITVLLDRALMRLGEAKLNDRLQQSPPLVWAELRSTFGTEYARHGAAVPAWRLMRDIDRPREDPAERPASYTQDIIDDWKQVARFLRDRVLPPLRLLIKPLRSRFAHEIFGDSIVRLLDRLEAGSGIAEWPITEQTARASISERGFDDPVIWNTFSSEFAWIYKMLLGPAGDDPSDGSRLEQFLAEAPADLGKVLKGVEDSFSGTEIDITVTLPNDAPLVFFPRTKLRELCNEIARNVLVHRDENHGVDTRPRLTFILDRSEDPDLVVLRAVCTATSPTHRQDLIRGTFLDRAGEELERFSGSLVHDPPGDLDGTATYETRITMTKVQR